MNEIITVAPMSNEEFLALYARPGCIGLIGGRTWVDRAIRRAERHLQPERRWSEWSHALIFAERRSDGHQWLLESDLAAARKHIRFGVQENRVTKYHDEKLYGSFAVLDFDLSDATVQTLVGHGLDMVAGGTEYSVRELLGTLLALRRPALRSRENVLARDNSFFCSAFVRHLYAKIGLDLAPGVTAKHTTPEDIAATALPHRTYLLDRHLGEGKIKEMTQKVHKKLRR